LASPSLQQKGVVVTFHLLLIVIAQEIVGEHFGGGNQSWSGHVLSSPPGIPSLNRQIRIARISLWLAHVALVTVEVEIDVIGQVHRAGLINGGAILDGDTVIVGQAIVRRSRRLPGSPDRHRESEKQRVLIARTIASGAYQNLPGRRAGGPVGRRQINATAIKGKAAVGDRFA
jgi:hypothetical protein